MQAFLKTGLDKEMILWYNTTVHHIGMSPSGKARDFDSRIRRSESGHPSQKKARESVLFSIQSEGLVCNHDAVVYGIAAGVWHHASACIRPSD